MTPLAFCGMMKSTFEIRQREQFIYSVENRRVFLIACILRDRANFYLFLNRRFLPYFFKSMFVFLCCIINENTINLFFYSSPTNKQHFLEFEGGAFLNQKTNTLTLTSRHSHQQYYVCMFRK